MENREFSSLIHLLRWWCSVGMLVSPEGMSGYVWWGDLRGLNQFTRELSVCWSQHTEHWRKKKLAMLSNWHRTWNPATDNRIPWFDKNYPEISGQRRQMPIKSSRGLPFISTIFTHENPFPAQVNPVPLSNELWVRNCLGRFFPR